MVGSPIWLIYCRVLRPVGRIRTYRLAGSKLIFFDLVQDGHKIQIMCNQRRLDGVSPAEFKALYRLLRRGDSFCMCLFSSYICTQLNVHSRNGKTAPYFEGRAHRAGGRIASTAISLLA